MLPFAVRGLPYRDRLSQALAELRHYHDRPLARAAAGVARFNLNAFSGTWTPSGIPQLDACAEQIAARVGHPGNPSRMSTDAGAIGRCPVDRTTDAIVTNYAALAASSSARSAATSLLRIAAAPTTTPTDVAKARVLAMPPHGVALDAERRQAAQALANDPQFGAFAVELLQR